MGIVLFGTTGESPTLSKYEKIQILSYVTENFLGKISIVVGIGGNDTFSVIEFAKECYTICSKISAFMVTVPNYNKPSQEGIFQHFKTISNNVMFPIMMYNIQSRCGVNMTPHTITKLYNEFKHKTLEDDFTLQKIVNRSLHQYLTDVDYQKSMLEYDKLQISGSRF